MIPEKQLKAWADATGVHPPRRKERMNTREPVRLLGYPITALLVATAALAALQAADWRAALAAAITVFVAGWKGTETVRGQVASPATLQRLHHELRDARAAQHELAAIHEQRATDTARKRPKDVPSPGKPPVQ